MAVYFVVCTGTRISSIAVHLSLKKNYLCNKKQICQDPDYYPSHVPTWRAQLRVRLLFLHGYCCHFPPSFLRKIWKKKIKAVSKGMQKYRRCNHKGTTKFLWIYKRPYWKNEYSDVMTDNFTSSSVRGEAPFMHTEPQHRLELLACCSPREELLISSCSFSLPSIGTELASSAA